MTKSERSPTGLFLEGLVILVSILAAFFLEGWRDDRELARELAQEMASVQLELERNRDLVVLERAALRRILDGTDVLVAAMAASEGSYVSVSDTLAWLGTSWNVSFSPSLGAVDALIASGRLAQVSNGELRLLLAGLRDIVADSFEEEEGARRISIDQVLPLLGERFDVTITSAIGRRFFDSGGDASGMTPQERVLNRPLVGSGNVQFPADLPMRNAIVHRLGWLSSGYAEFGSLELHLGRMIRLVAEERASLPDVPAS